MLKLFKFIAILSLVLTFPAEAQMSKTAVQSQILLNWPDNNSNAITASKLRIPNQIIVNSYLDLNGATSFQCPANQAMIGFSTLSTPSCSLVSGLLTTTGTGAFVLANSPTLVTPNLGTPSVVVLTNGTGLPVSTGITGLGTGVSTSLATSVGTAGSVVINGGALGTPSSGVGTNLTALNASNLASGTVPAARINTFVPVLLNTVSGTTLSDTTSLTASFQEYDIVFQNVLPNTNAITLVLQLQSGGTFQTTGYVATVIESNSVNTSIGNSNTITTGIPFTTTSNANNTGQGCSGHLHIVNPSNTTIRKTVYGQMSCSNSGSAARQSTIGGYWDGGNGAITGIQVSPSSGTITSGTMKIYGVP